MIEEILELENHKISVIVPVSEKTIYLSDCLDSIVEQEGLNIEVIIVDDNADSTLEEILQRYTLRFCFF